MELKLATDNSNGMPAKPFNRTIRGIETILKGLALNSFVLLIEPFVELKLKAAKMRSADKLPFNRTIRGIETI